MRFSRYLHLAAPNHALAARLGGQQDSLTQCPSAASARPGGNENMIAGIEVFLRRANPG